MKIPFDAIIADEKITRYLLVPIGGTGVLNYHLTDSERFNRGIMRYNAKKQGIFAFLDI